MDDLKGGPKKRKISREKAFGIAFPGVPYKASTFTKAYRTYELGRQNRIIYKQFMEVDREEAGLWSGFVKHVTS
ncbi:hypothetical protein K435DRAFT_781945 [Dendrothele bispora CBS 962.96]|uniref:Uncharacterized protein n=1 Tax=Dendrothele bispora (strain CBS 962.96) TaxID=1314807 RepID=A0A4S8LI05_DENBC|nr:hypothetical protein K435DRAFT_781945 [Dendrothele bispora CBS 962.96]